MVAVTPTTSSRIITRVALTATHLVASDERFRARGQADAGWRTELAPAPLEGVAWPAFGAALRELAAAVGASHGSLRVALLAPYCEVRRIEIPPMRDDERLRLLTRNAARYFLNVRESQVVGIAPTTRSARGVVIGAAVPARLLAMIHHEAAAAGWIVDNVVPAEAAWASGATTVWPAFSRGRGNLLIAHDGRVDLVQVLEGRIIGVRRFRAGAADADDIVKALNEGASGKTSVLAMLGTSEERRELARALSDRGIAITPPPAKWQSVLESPSLAAASFIAADERFRIRTDDAVAMRAARSRSAALQLALAAGVLLLAAAGMQWWGVRRELNAVKAQRAAIAPQVRALLSGQVVSDASSRRLTSISESQAASPQWSAAIASLSGALDENAHLLTLRARGDTLVLDGLAKNAGDAFASIENVAGFSGVRAAGEMRVERQDDGTMLERFTIQARVVRDSGNGVKKQ